MTHVPFDLDPSYGGLAETSGLVSNEGDRLRLQFQSRDSLVGVIQSEVRQIDVPMSDVAWVRFERSWFGLVSRLVIQITRLDLVQSLPGMRQGRLILRISRRDRAMAERFAVELASLERSGKSLSTVPGIR